jgi:hypothetical protein
MVNRASSPTRDETWPVLFIQQEQFRIGPYIARIGGDKERQIANQAQASGVGMFLEALALAEKQKLCEPHLIDLACQLLACTRQSLGNASDQLRRPLEVIIVAMFGSSPDRGTGRSSASRSRMTRRTDGALPTRL